ncbi:MAG: hypothetical protein M1839_004659 [Geoglossum umbratile]|nr:MAG: hypothetical protein M1839_004659 [Geoglossum umbratile]
MIRGLDPTYITRQTFLPAPEKYGFLFHDWMLVEAFDNLPVQDGPESSGTDMQKYGQLDLQAGKIEASSEDLEHRYSGGSLTGAKAPYFPHGLMAVLFLAFLFLAA